MPLLLLISLCASSFYAEDTVMIVDPSTQYICPPCGCIADHIIYEAPGLCGHCSMNLMNLGTGFKRKARIQTAPLFQNARYYAKYYIRIAYPLIILGILFAMFLLVRTGKNQRLFFFAIFILSLSLYMLKFQLYGSEYSVSSNEIFLFMPISLLLIVWPALYFFLEASICKVNFSYNELKVHFLPGITFLLIQLIFFIGYPLSSKLLYNHFDTLLNPIEQIFFVFGGVIYGSKVFKLKKPKSNSFNSDSIRSKLKIIYLFIILTCLTLSVLLFLNLYLYQGMIATLDYHPLWFLFTLFIPWFCYEAWSNRQEFMVPKYKNYRLKKDQIEALKDVFDKTLNSTVLEKSSFNLNEAAGLLKIKPREMSEFINRAYDSNYYEVINLKRVESAKSKLLLPEFEHLTNEAIGQSCGFGSKTTFIKSFKTHTGYTPSEFKKINKQSNS